MTFPFRWDPVKQHWNPDMCNKENLLKHLRSENFTTQGERKNYIKILAILIFLFLLFQLMC